MLWTNNSIKLNLIRFLHYNLSASTVCLIRMKQHAHAANIHPQLMERPASYARDDTHSRESADHRASRHKFTGHGPLCMSCLGRFCWKWTRKDKGITAIVWFLCRGPPFRETWLRSDIGEIITSISSTGSNGIQIQYLCAPCTSTDAEWLFNCVYPILDEKRNRLKQDGCLF